jgi:hypothetical protein
MAVSDMIAQWVMFQAFTGLGQHTLAARIGNPYAPAEVRHSGGVVGQGGMTRNVPAALFAGAPRLHSGLAADEFPSILQRGERVIPKGGGGGSAPIINIYEAPGQKMKVGNQFPGQKMKVGNQFYDGKRWVIDIVANDIQSGGQLRKLIER